METAINSARLVRTALWGSLKFYRGIERIVETPSTGTLVAPAWVCGFITNALTCMLNMALECTDKPAQEGEENERPPRIYVRCTIDHTRLLKLEVAYEGDLPSWNARRTLQVLSGILQDPYPGSFECGRLYGADSDMVMRITIQLPRPAKAAR